jgi:hypothetical protein
VIQTSVSIGDETFRGQDLDGNMSTISSRERRAVRVCPPLAFVNDWMGGLVQAESPVPVLSVALLRDGRTSTDGGCRLRERAVQNTRLYITR